MHSSANGELVSVVKRAASRREEVYLVRRSRPGSPNATISIYEAGRNENTLAVVEISHPVMDGKDLVYSYKLIEGAMPKAGGATALFIDWGGAGGGGGVGFHGVGVGARGIGWR